MHFDISVFWQRNTGIISQTFYVMKTGYQWDTQDSKHIARIAKKGAKRYSSQWYAHAGSCFKHEPARKLL